MYLDLGILKSTKNAYKAGLNKYISFCMETYHRLLSVREDTLLLFVTYLAQQHLSYATIQVYLPAVKHNLVTAGKYLPERTPQLTYILKGIQRSLAIAQQPKERLPITSPIMQRLHSMFSNNPQRWYDLDSLVPCLPWSTKSKRIYHIITHRL